MALYVDYESPLAREVAGVIWSGLSAAALGSGYVRITALWESLRDERSPRERGGHPTLSIFVVGQDRPDAVDAMTPVGGAPGLYGVVVAVPPTPSPLSGPLLYQGVGSLTQRGVAAGHVEPAPLRAAAGECEMYAQRLLERLRKMEDS